MAFSDRRWLRRGRGQRLRMKLAKERAYQEMTIRHAIVTGASRGLGHAVVERLANEGWTLSFGARTASRLRELEETIGCGHIGIELDVSQEKSVESFFNEAVGRNGRPDAVVHCAGVYGPFGPTATIDTAEWVEALNTNLLGTFFVSRNALKLMDDSKGGSIVILSGGGATSPMPNISAYAASKAAVVRLTETLAREIRSPNLQINAVAPGIMATQMLDQVLSAGPELVGQQYFEKMEGVRSRGEDSTEDALSLISFLLNNHIPDLSGRLVSAVWDDWRKWNEETSIFEDKDALTLRRQLLRQEDQI